ncbi:hypothetical protein ASD64_09370 [Mesorhizobium sp. Root157]|nr:hypothetical protein ASD64_09370 [Mesorhizobium sp. Root157]
MIFFPEIRFGRTFHGCLPDRSHAPYSKRPASANTCRKIDKISKTFPVAFPLQEVANQLWN